MKSRRKSTRSRRQPDGPRYVVNVRLLVGSVVAFSALVVAAWWWHGVQLHRLADSLLERASQLENESNWRLASDYIHHYLRLRPDDGPARVRLARTYDKGTLAGGTPARAIDLYYRAVGVSEEPTRFELRQRLSELLLEAGRFLEAESEAVAMLSENPADPAACRTLAVALYGQLQQGQLRQHPLGTDSAARAGESGEGPRGDDGPLATGESSAPLENAEPSRNLGAALEQAVALNPDHVDLAIQLATVLRDFPQHLSAAQRTRHSSLAERTSAADQAVDSAVLRADSAEAYLRRFLYRQTYNVPGGASDLREALAREPDNPQVLLTAAEHARELADQARPRNAAAEELVALYADAEQKFRRAVEVEPAGMEQRLGLASVLQARGDLPAAIQVLSENVEDRQADDPRRLLRLAELQVLDNRLQAARQTLDRLNADMQTVRPGLTAAFRRTREMQRRWLEASWLLRSGNPLEAIGWIRPATTSDQVPFQFRAWFLLGQCYAETGQTDRAAEAFTQAASLQPDSLESRLAAANAWVASGQPPQAVAHLTHALTLVDSLEIRARLAAACLAVQSVRPAQDRDWLAFENQMAILERADARQQMEQPWMVALLRLERTGIDRDSADDDAAVKVLQSLEQDFADDPDLLRQLVLRYESLGQAAAADRALRRYGELAEDATEVRYLESRLLARRQRFPEALRLLEEHESNGSDRMRRNLDEARVQTLLAAQRLEDAQRELERQQRRYPNDPRILLELGELHLRNENLAEVTRCEQTLRASEGEDGSCWRYLRVLRVLEEAGAGPDADSRLDEAEREQRKLQALRPAWAKTHVLEAAIQERRGQDDRAIQAYQRAMDLGEQNPVVYQRLSLLLSRAGRLAEAQQMLDVRRRRRLPLTDSDSALAISLAARRNDLPEALRLAEESTTQQPDQPTAWLQYGQTLALAERIEEAGAAFHKAAELDPTDVATWIAQFAFLTQTGQRDAARELLPRLHNVVKTSEADRQFILAQACEALGDRPQARTHYAQAARLNSGNANVLIRVAAFYRDEDPAAAEQTLRQVLKQDPDNPAARHSLAVLCARRGAFDQVETLLAKDSQTGEQALGDARLQAALLIQREPPELEQAEQLLQGVLRETGEPTDVERMLLAHIYLKQREASDDPAERDDKLKLAQRQFTALCARSEPDPYHLRLYVGLLMQEQLWSEAATWLRSLEQIAADDLATLALRCQWHAKQQQLDPVEPLVERFAERFLGAAEDSVERTRRRAALGRMLAELKLDTLAEGWLQQAADEDPEYFQDLVACYVRQDKGRQAIQLCMEEANRSGSILSARTLASVLAMTKDNVPAAEALLERALQANPRDAELLTAVANLRILRQGRIAEAINLYRQALEAEPDNILALNNLAMILAEQGMAEEARSFIDRAILLVGGKAPLLDTKGMVLLHADRVSEATECFRLAISRQPGDPLLHFHLAVALSRGGDIENARWAYARARENELASQPLTPTDRQLWTELRATLSGQDPVPE